MKASHKPLYGYVFHMVSLHLRACSLVLWIWLFLIVAPVWSFPRLSSFSMHGIAGAMPSIQASEEHRQSPWSQPCHRSAPSWTLLLRLVACNLASSSAHSANACSFCFLDNIVQAPATSNLSWLTFRFVWVFHSPTYTLQEVLDVRSEILQSQSTPQKDWHPSLLSKKTLMICSETLFLLVWFFESLRRNISMKDVSLSVSWNFNRSSSWCRDIILHA